VKLFEITTDELFVDEVIAQRSLTPLAMLLID
jgi:hypothetical protein